MRQTKKCSVAQVRLCKFIAYLAAGTIDLYAAAGKVDWMETPIAQLDLPDWEAKLVRDVYTDEYYSRNLANELNQIRTKAIQHIKKHNLNYTDLTERMLITINTVGYNPV